MASQPPRVDYELTELGQSLFGQLTRLADWALSHRTEITRARALFDIANDEYKKMIDMARDALAPYPTHVDANVEAAES